LDNAGQTWVAFVREYMKNKPNPGFRRPKGVITSGGELYLQGTQPGGGRQVDTSTPRVTTTTSSGSTGSNDSGGSSSGMSTGGGTTGGGTTGGGSSGMSGMSGDGGPAPAPTCKPGSTTKPPGCTVLAPG
jgi:hypothetical protein